MALLIGDNFSYNGKKPNFERDSFETLAALKAVAEANIDNGHITYCVETKKHYIFNDTNTIDESTGKWRELESEFSNKVNVSDLDNYLTKEVAQSTYQPVGDYALKSDISNLATKDEIPTNVSSFTNDAGYITNSALTDYAKKSEIPDISNLATKSELSNYAPVEHTHVVADITDFPEIPDISNLATKDEVDAKQDALVSGTNIKTINGTSLLGSGNITIEAGGGSEITDVLDNKICGRTQGSWVDLTDYLTWGEYD